MSSSYKKPGFDSKYFEQLLNSLPTLESNTIAITGTTSGMGFIAAEACARLGAKVILLNRPSPRSDNSFAKLKMNVSNAQFYKVDCDLQSFASVRVSIDEINELCPEGLNVLCNNAGIMAFRDEATIDGYDVQMQTNHLSHFLLTKLLMPKLEEAAEKYGEARVVNHSSVARHQQKNLKSEYLERRGGKLGGDGASMFFSGARWVRYSQTKLANAAFTACLHEKFQKSNPKLKAMVAHPGLAESELQSNTVKDGGMGSFFTRYLMKLGQSEKDGSLGLLRCIADPKINSGVIVGPGLRGLKGKAKAFPLEKFYDNDNTKSLLWSKSCEAISEEFNI